MKSKRITALVFVALSTCVILLLFFVNNQHKSSCYMPEQKPTEYYLDVDKTELFKAIMPYHYENTTPSRVSVVNGVIETYKAGKDEIKLFRYEGDSSRDLVCPITIKINGSEVPINTYNDCYDYDSPTFDTELVLIVEQPVVAYDVVYGQLYSCSRGCQVYEAHLYLDEDYNVITGNDGSLICSD